MLSVNNHQQSSNGDTSPPSSNRWWPLVTMVPWSRWLQLTTHNNCLFNSSQIWEFWLRKLEMRVSHRSQEKHLLCKKRSLKSKICFNEWVSWDWGAVRSNLSGWPVSRVLSLPAPDNGHHSRCLHSAQVIRIVEHCHSNWPITAEKKRHSSFGVLQWKEPNSCCLQRFIMTTLKARSSREINFI